MTHTPGPWKPFVNNSVVAVMKGGSRKEVIKWTGFDGSDFPNDVEANARLIAAAPDLLAALKLVDYDVRHHLRNDDIGTALIRPHAVKAVRDALSLI